MRWRSFIAGFAILFLLVVYCLIMSQLFLYTVGVPAWLVWPLYLVAGIAWVFPCVRLFRWAAKDPDGTLTNEMAEKKFSEGN